MTPIATTTSRESIRYGSVFQAAKLPGKKDAFRADNIPEALRANVRITESDVTILCNEGIQHVPYSSAEDLHNIVVAYESSDSELEGFDGQPVRTGWNAWHKSNALHADGSPWTLKEVDGTFYSTSAEPVPYRMCILTDAADVPELIHGADAWCDGDTWSVKTPWGVSSAAIGSGLWVRYEDNPDGSVNANILSFTEKSFAQYYLYKDGKLCEPLTEIFG